MNTTLLFCFRSAHPSHPNGLILALAENPTDMKRIQLVALDDVLSDRAAATQHGVYDGGRNVFNAVLRGSGEVAEEVVVAVRGFKGSKNKT